MSFAFGSDDEDGDGAGDFFMPSWKLDSAAAVNSSDRKLPAQESESLDLSEDDDDDAMVDWEDAVEEEPRVSNTNVTGEGEGETSADGAAQGEPNQFPNLKPVTVDLGHSRKPETSTSKQRPRRRRNVWKFSQLPNELQTNLRNLQKCHLLSWISHVTFVACHVVTETELACAISFIPNTFLTEETATPTRLQVQDFLTWYSEWILEQVRQKQQPRGRRGKGRSQRGKQKALPVSKETNESKKYSFREVFREWICALLQDGPTEENLGLHLLQSHWHPLFSNLLCCGLMRWGLGWRVRWCMALKDVVRLDLDVAHPWLSCSLATFDIFRAAAVKCPSPSSSPAVVTPDPQHSEKRKKQKRSQAQTTTPVLDVSNESNFFCGWGWMEIRCLGSTKDSTSNKDNKARAHWVHADAGRSTCSARHQPKFLLNQPHIVESKLEELETKSLLQSDNASSNPTSTFPRSQLPHMSCQRNNKRARSTSTPTARPVAYVLAVEPNGRWADVTPRYATSRVATLEQRGLTRQEIQNELSNISSEQSSWWAKALRTINQQLQLSTPNQNTLVGGKSAKDAIVLDDYGEDRKPSAMLREEEDKDIKPEIGSQGDCEEGIEIEDDRKPPAVTTHDDSSAPPSPVAGYEAMEEEVSFSTDNIMNEPMPTSKSGFQNHPVYALKSKLGKTQVVAPTAKVCGLFAGESVYLRKDVSTAMEAHAWLYRSRKVKSNLLKCPVVKLAPRKKPARKGFQALATYGVGQGNDGSEEQRAAQVAAGSLPEDQENPERLLYGVWQTSPWSPPRVGPQDPIPVNEHKNVELALLNPGLVHIDIPVAAVQAAKQLGVPYAPCLIGFGTNGQGMPVIRGIVVHQHNADIISQAAEHIAQHRAEQEHNDRQRVVYRRWKKLMVGILVKQRLDREYGAEQDSDDIEEIS